MSQPIFSSIYQYCPNAFLESLGNKFIISQDLRFRTVHFLKILRYNIH